MAPLTICSFLGDGAIEYSQDYVPEVLTFITALLFLFLWKKLQGGMHVARPNAFASLPKLV